MDDVRFKQLPATEVLQFNEDADAGNLTSKAGNEITACNKSSTGRNEVINNENPLRGPDGVCMHLERIRSIFKSVFLRDRVEGQAAWFSNRYEPGIQSPGNRSSEDEAPRLRSHYDVDVRGSKRGSHQLDGKSQPGRVCHQWGDVPKKDSGRGKVGDITYQ